MRPQSWATSPAVRRSMLGNRRRDTIPELALRSELHRLGLRFRVDARPVATIPRRADIVLRGDRVAVFLDGCFWHGCPEHFRPPATNAGYWAAKIAGNRARDGATGALLEAAGWTVVRIWEHEPVDAAARRVAAVLVLARADVSGRARSRPPASPPRSPSSARRPRPAGHRSHPRRPPSIGSG
jgi:DNA mismatch endonuclease, patch repair protein